MVHRRSPRRHQARSAGKRPVAGTLRIIGGSLRGRPIQYLGDPRTRPMKQRVREAAFNLLGQRVRKTHVLDLFAGTGALTWEALSRGAEAATLLEQHFPSAQLIRHNAQSLGLTGQIEVVAGDTFFWARRELTGGWKSANDRPWLVFCSPPYEFYVSRAEAMDQLVDQLCGVAPPGSLVVVEADQRFDASRLVSTLTWDVRTYAPAVLAIAERT